MCLGSMFTECNSGKEYTVTIRIWLKVTHLFPSDLLASVMRAEQLWVAPVPWLDVLNVQRVLSR